MKHERLTEFMGDSMRSALAAVSQRTAAALQARVDRESQRAESAAADAASLKERLSDSDGARRASESRVR
jgi:hypothetical protein